MTFLSQIFLQTSFPHQELNLLCTLFLSILLFGHDLILLSFFALLNTAELRVNKTCILRIIILFCRILSETLTTQLKGRFSI